MSSSNNSAEYTPPDFTGDTVDDRWVVGEILGTGSVGAVYSVTDNTQEHPNAVVKFAVVESGDEDELEDAQDDLEEEYNKLRDLNIRAPNLKIPKAFALGTHNEFTYMVMSRFGDSVETAFGDAETGLSNAAIVVMTMQVFKTMWALHNLNFKHGDIKEGNVVRGYTAGQKDQWFLIDFGLCETLNPYSEINDVGDLIQMMVKLFRNSEEGLIPEGELSRYTWYNLSDDQMAVIKNNFGKAVATRNDMGQPIPENIKILVDEALSMQPPNYERMNTLLQQTIDQIVDPNQNLFDQM